MQQQSHHCDLQRLCDFDFNEIVLVKFTQRNFLVFFLIFLLRVDEVEAYKKKKKKLLKSNSWNYRK